jgi:uncharacterized protein (TIGR02996 family)
MLDTATETAFLRTILADPDDDAPRLVYADWLDENGDADRAEFIRLQVRLARMEVDDPEYDTVEARAEELRRVHHIEWLNELPQCEHVNWEVFHRGFISAVKFDHPEAYFAHARQVFAAAPVWELRLHQFYPHHATRLAESRSLRHIRVLDLNDGNRVANQGLEALMASPHLSQLATLKVGRNSLGSAGVRAIAQSGYVRNLRRLRLERNDLFDDGLRYLAASPAMQGLAILDMERTRTGDDAVAALARSQHLTRLRLLDLGNNLLTDSGLSALARSEVLADVRVLYLQGNSLTDRGVWALSESPQFGRLERLFLQQNAIGDDSALALARSPHLTQLREIYLGGNRISDQAAEMLRARFGPGVNVY